MNKILLIDDNIDICETISDILVAEDFEVIFETDEKKGIEKAIKLCPDIILCDMRMSTPDEGFYVLSEIRKNETTKNIPFLFYTIVSDISLIVKGLELGAQDYIVKTDPNEVLLARIKAHLSTNESRVKELEKRNQELFEVNSQLINSKAQQEKLNNDLVQQINNLKKQGKVVSSDELENLIKDILGRLELYSDKTDLSDFTKEILLDMLAKLKIEQVFSILRLKTKDSEHLSTTIVLMSQYNDFVLKKINNLISTKESSRIFSGLNFRLIDFIKLIYNNH